METTISSLEILCVKYRHILLASPGACHDTCLSIVWSSMQRRLATAYARESPTLVATDTDTELLLSELHRIYEHLAERGYTMDMLRRELASRQHVSPIYIDADFNIFLPEYSATALPLTPLQRTVYILFLRHPEGIILKNLPDYQEETTEIYTRIISRNLTPRTIKNTISNILSPASSSINENISRISHTLAGVLPSTDFLTHYAISGHRNARYGINLSPQFITFS